MTPPPRTAGGPGADGAPPRHQQVLAVAVGGALGTLGRAALTDTALADALARGVSLEPGSPLALLVAVMTANLAGTFVLGALTSALLTSASRGARLASLGAGTGLCGALTTFSGLALDVLRLTSASPPAALVPTLAVAACAAAGVAAAVAGWFAGSVLRARFREGPGA